MADLKRQIQGLLASKNFFWLNAVSIGAGIAGMGLSYLFQSLPAPDTPLAKFIAPLFHLPTLSLADYGLFAVMVATWNVLSIPVNGLVNLLSRELARREKHPAQVRYLLRKYLWRVGWASALGFGALALGALAVGQPLMALVLLALPFWYVMGVVLGYLQSHERIIELSIANNGAILLRAGALLLFLTLGWGLYGAVGALLASAMAACALCVGPALVQGGAEEKVEMQMRWTLIWLIPAQLLLTLMTALDLIAVQHLLSSEQAGLYNAAEITAKILFSLGTAIALVLHPKISKMDGHTAVKEGGKLLLSSFALLLPVAVGFELLAGPFLGLFFGPAFAASVGPFRVLTLSMLALGWSVILANYLWARHVEKSVLAAYGMAILAQGGLLLWQLPAAGMMGAAWASVGAGALLLLMLLALTLNQMKKEWKARSVVGAPPLFASGFDPASFE